MAMAAPRPRCEAVTSALRPSRRKESRTMRLVLAALFQAGATLIESGLDVYHAELPILHLPMRGHRPQETDAVIRDRDIGMKTAGHEHSIAVAHHGNQFRIFGVVVDQLDRIGGRGHVEEYVHFFQHLGVLMRWPTGPIAGFGIREAGDQSSS